jgi:hypothetical protein
MLIVLLDTMLMMIIYARNVTQDVKLVNITQLIVYHVIVHLSIQIFIMLNAILLVQILLMHLVIFV